MGRKYLILFFIASICLYQKADAQGSEFGFIAGGMAYRGDIAPEFYQFHCAKPAIAFVYRYNFSPHYAFKANIATGNVTASDANSTDAFRYKRNLSFRSKIQEISAQMEFNFFSYRPQKENERFAPYIFTGFSIFRFKPEASLPNGDWVALQPLGTEGQGKGYNLIEYAIPMGGGLKWCLGTFAIGVELGARATFTDYLDDVSGTYAGKQRLSQLSAYFSDRSSNADTDDKAGRQRGNSKNDDWFMFGGVVFSVNLSDPDHCLPFLQKY